jgi:hypothetical protein
MFNLFSIFGIIGVGFCKLVGGICTLIRLKKFALIFKKWNKSCWNFIFQMEGIGPID